MTTKKRRSTWFGLGVAFAALLGMAVVMRGAEVAEAHAGDKFKFSSANYSVIEGNSATITVLRVVESPDPDDHLVSISFTDGSAVNGVDYGNSGCFSPTSSVQIPFDKLDPSRTFTVFTCENADTEDKTFTITISNVNESGGTTAPASAEVTIEDKDGPQPATITSINPTNGPTTGGTTVTIHGSGFSGTDCDLSGGIGVTFGGTQAQSCTVDGPTQIRAVSPDHALGTVDVVVNNGNGPSVPNPATANDFTYIEPGAPAITSISPQSGNTGATVDITGVNFSPNPSVTFGSVPAAIIGTPTSTFIRVQAPDPGTATRPFKVDVRVTVSGVQSANTAADDFTYTNISVTGISPSSGPPGIEIDIFGSGFTSGSTVTVGGIPATGKQFISSTHLKVTVPTPDTTTRPIVRDVIVTDGATSSANTSADDFTYAEVSILSISPQSGPPGTVVTITGTGFTSQPTVRFGTALATVNSFSATTIQAVAPSGTGTVNVSVTVGGVTSPDAGTADNYTYSSGVVVTELDPNIGSTAGGTQVTIRGGGFFAGAIISVTFGGVAATNITRVSDTELTATSPAHAVGVVDVRVTVNGAMSPNTVSDDFTYADIPVITSINPKQGPAGGTTIVTILGANFVEGSVVKFGDIEAVRTIISSTEIRAVTPNTAPPGTVDVTVSNGAGTSAKGPQTVFTFTGQGGTPTVTGLSPNSAPVNTSGVEVTITGTNFATPATVKFGNVEASNVQVLSSTQIKAVAPLRATPGVVDVTVTTAGGTSSVIGTGNDFTYGSASGATTSYQLFVRFTLITWAGENNIPVGDALRGLESPDNPATNNVTNIVSAVYFHSANGAGCPSGQTTCWHAYFPAGVSVPGANNLATLIRGTAYWIAVLSNVTWTVLTGQ